MKTAVVQRGKDFCFSFCFFCLLPSFSSVFLLFSLPFSFSFYSCSLILFFFSYTSQSLGTILSPVKISQIANVIIEIAITNGTKYPEIVSASWRKKWETKRRKGRKQEKTRRKETKEKKQEKGSRNDKGNKICEPRMIQNEKWKGQIEKRKTKKKSRMMKE